METLNITKEAANKAHESAKPSGKKLLENLFGKNVFIKNIRERINGWEDILELNNMTQKQFDELTKGRLPHEVAQKQEEMIAYAYNGGGKPDWSDGKPKGVLIFNMDESPSGGGFSLLGVDIWYSFSRVGARLVFIGPDWYENAHDAAKKFLSIYKQSRTY